MSWLWQTAAYISERSRKIVEEIWPPLKIENKVGHTSSTILNSCSFQRYRMLSVKASSFFLTHPLNCPNISYHYSNCDKFCRSKGLLISPVVWFIMSILRMTSMYTGHWIMVTVHTGHGRHWTGVRLGPEQKIFWIFWQWTRLWGWYL